MCTSKCTVPLAHPKLQKTNPISKLGLFCYLIAAAADLQSCSVKNLIEISNTKVHRRLPWESSSRTKCISKTVALNVCKEEGKK